MPSTLVGSDIPPVSLEFAIDMLRKLTTEPDVYDCACLIVVEGAGGTVEEPTVDDRDIDEEPTALLNLPEVDDDSGSNSGSDDSGPDDDSGDLDDDSHEGDDDDD